MFHLKRTICALLVFAALASASAAQATIYYVATTGSDSNPGTLAQPFRTIAKGVSVLEPGDTTFVRAGTYAEGINTFSLNFPSGTSWVSPVKLAAYPGESVTMRPGGGDSVFNFGAEPDQYIIIDGLIIDAIKTLGNAVTIHQGSNHIRFQNCEIKNSYLNGVMISWGNINVISSDYNEIINCKIHHNARSAGTTNPGPDVPAGFGAGHGIYITTSYNIIRGNTIHDTGEFGIHQWTALPKFANYNVIEGNTVYGSGYNTTRYGHVCCGGIVASAGTGTVIRNNLVYGNLVNGIDIGNNCVSCKIYNNTFHNNPGWNIYTFDGGSGREVRNNIAYPKGIYTGTGTTASNNLTTDPDFVDATAKDFRLLSSSPAIDAGMTLSAVPDDFARVARPQGSAHDIGAYEFSGNQSDVAPAPPMNLMVH